MGDPTLRQRYTANQRRAAKRRFKTLAGYDWTSADLVHENGLDRKLQKAWDDCAITHGFAAALDEWQFGPLTEFKSEPAQFNSLRG